MVLFKHTHTLPYTEKNYIVKSYKEIKLQIIFIYLFPN